MSQAGYTPIQLYYSTTAAATPSAGNLANGELAINITDGRLFYKDNGGTVRVLAGTGGSGVVAGSNTQVQFNNNGVFGASANMVFNGTRLTVADLADSGLTSSRVVYASTGGALVDSANLTFDGTTLTANALTVTNATTLNAGTANGVAYLNGSKVLTTGSALTFDGTNLGVGGTAIEKITTDGNIASTAAQAYIYSNGGSGTSVNAGFLLSGSDNTVRFYANNSEQMRLTSTGLGIGTSSPGYKLDVRGVVAGGNGTIVGGISYSTRPEIGALSNHPVGFITNNTTQMLLDTSGNLGLGVTPSAWGGGIKALQLGGYGVLAQSSTAFNIGNNYYNNGTSSLYINSAAATLYQQLSGQHIFYTAPSGTAGNPISFTQAMTLDASGNLLVGVTSASFSAANRGVVNIGGSSGGLLALSSGANKGYLFQNGADLLIENDTATGAIVFGTNTSTERASIDSSGNLLVGTTSRFSTERVSINQTVAGAQALYTKNLSGDFNFNCWNAATSGDNQFIQFITEASPTSRGSITYNRGAGLVAYNTTSDYRAKDIIGPVVDSGALIDSVPVYMGKMKGATQERPMFIAHETPEYAHTGEKDAVDVDGKPVYQQMDASALIPVMWAEIQSLRKRLAAAGIA